MLSQFRRKVALVGLKTRTEGHSLLAFRRDGDQALLRSRLKRNVPTMSTNASRKDAEAAVLKLLELLAPSSSDIWTFEEMCMSTLMAAGRHLMKVHLEALSPTTPLVEDGTTWKVAVASRLPVMTTFGAVIVERPLFRAVRNGPTRCFVEERTPLVAGFWTERAAKLGALAVSEMPMARAEQFFAEAGTMVVSSTSLLRLAGSMSTLWEENRREHERQVRTAQDIPLEATAVAVSLDGVMISTVDSDKAAKKAEARARGQADKGPSGWREASVGVLAFYDKDGERLETRRYGRMPEEDKATTKSWLRDEIEHLRNKRPDLTVLAIADGAANNWSFLSKLDADHEAVDFYHTAEHLHRHVSKANGASTIDTQSKLRAMRRALRDEPGAAAKVFKDFQQLREDAGTQAVSTKKQEGKRQPTYFERHHERMDYAGLRALNLPIGSGVTESTCKLVVCDRLRRTGMRWSERGGQAVMTLRAAQVSNTFEPMWGVLRQANRASRRELKHAA